MTDAATILLVEDDRDIREAIGDALEDEGYVVVGASDGIEALDRLREAAAPPSLILLDLMMPRMTGAQFCDEARKVAAWASVPIVLLTADMHAKEKAASCGAAGYLRKPVKLGVLFDTVARVLERV